MLGCCIWNLIQIGLVVSEKKKSFEKVDDIDADNAVNGWWTTVYTIRSPGAFGSSELKILLLEEYFSTPAIWNINGYKCKPNSQIIKGLHSPVFIIKSFMVTSSPKESGQLCVSEFSEPENKK